MLQSFILLLFLVVVFGALFLVLKATTKIRNGYTNSGIGKTIVSFPISYKMNGYVVRVADRYYICNDLGGMIETPYDESFDTVKLELKFDKVMAEEFAKIKDFDIKKVLSKYKK